MDFKIRISVKNCSLGALFDAESKSDNELHFYVLRNLTPIFEAPKNTK